MELEIKDCLERSRQNVSFVLTVILEASGSTPRHAGSMMLTDWTGNYGTIGGGKLEYLAQQRAAEYLRDRTSQTDFFLLNNVDAGALGMACGGTARLLFLYIDGQSEALKKIWESANELEQEKTSMWLLIQTDEAANWSLRLYTRTICVAAACGRDGAAQEMAVPKQDIEADEKLYQYLYGTQSHQSVGWKEKNQWNCCIPLSQTAMVYVFGGGHVSKALVPVLKSVFFRCTVWDDLEEFANPTRFPSADELCVDSFEKISEKIQVTQEDYAVVVTRGHMWDYVCVREILKTPARYIGMIGSRKKRETVYQMLREDGFTQRDIARIHSPIGIPIGGGTPEEIAISITAELILERSGGKKR